MTDFPAHYSETSRAVLSLDGWTKVGYIMHEGASWADIDVWMHDDDTLARVYCDGTISTFPMGEDD